MNDQGPRKPFTQIDPRARAAERRYPISVVEVTATTVGAAQSFFVAPIGEISLLESFFCSNGSATATTLSVAVSEGSPVAADVVIDALTIPANHVIDMGRLVMAAPGQTVWVFAAASVRVSGWVTSYL